MTLFPLNYSLAKYTLFTVAVTISKKSMHDYFLTMETQDLPLSDRSNVNV